MTIPDYLLCSAVYAALWLVAVLAACRVCGINADQERAEREAHKLARRFRGAL